MRWYFMAILMVLMVSMAGCTDTKQEGEFAGKTIVVCSGAGLMKPMNELIKNFEEKTGAKVEVHYGGSAEIYGILTTTGCDVFIPGAYYYTNIAMEKGYLVNDTVKNVTLHIPVIAVPKGNPKNIHSLEDLAKPGVRVVLGDPKACAIGKVAKKILEKNGLWENVSKNVVVKTPTVNQLLIYIATEQADAAIIWEDMTSWAEAKGKIEVVHIPPEKNIIKTIPTAVTVHAKENGNFEVAKAFNDYITSEEGLKIWEKWGFKPCR
jgi:molybdate transport system substrate-binding protein